MELVLPMLTFVVVFCAVLIWGGQVSPVSIRLARHVGGERPVAPGEAARAARVPLQARLAALASRATKVEVKEKTARLLQQAGSTMSVSAFLLIRIAVLIVVAPIVVMAALRSQGLTPMGLGMAAVGAIAVQRLPTFAIQRRAKQRGAAIEKALPDALDLLVVCVEGGLSLDGGLLQVGQRTTGPVAEEFRKLQRDMAAGMGRRDAFIALADRSPSDSLALVASTITQADKMGMSIGTTLRTLSETMRTRRRQAAEEKARKAPVKMMPVLIFFMLPAMFAVILGSAVISFMDAF